MFAAGRHVYLAAPFFNDKQRELCAFMESLATDWEPIYSPRWDGGVLTPDATDLKVKETFESNCIAIEASSWVLAVVDDFDAGVLWEMGYAFARGKPILAYTDVKGRGLNVMLAGSARLGFIDNREHIGDIMRGPTDAEFSRFPFNTWRGQIQ